MDLPSIANWLSPSALFAVATGLVGGALSYVGLPQTSSRWLRFSLVSLLGILAIAAAYNAAVQDRDSAVVMGAARDQGPRFNRIERKLERLAAGLNVPLGGELEDRVDKALAKAAARKSRRIDSVIEKKPEPKPTTQESSRFEPASAREPRASTDRSSLLAQLTQLYILSHDGISSEMLAGLETPPVDWLNTELAKRRADWRVVSCEGGSCQTRAVD